MRLIDADSLKERLGKISRSLNPNFNPMHEIGLRIGVETALEELDQAPMVEERKYGLWLGKPLAGRYTVRCSCCRTVFRENSGRWAYCPYCGAKMDGGK